MRLAIFLALAALLAACGPGDAPRAPRDISLGDLSPSLPCAVMNAGWERDRSDADRHRIQLCESSRHVAATREMLANGQDPVRLRDRFLKAAGRADYETIASAIDQGIHLDTIYCGDEGDQRPLTALSRAIEAGDDELAEFLRASGAATSNEDRLYFILKEQQGAVRIGRSFPVGEFALYEAIRHAGGY